MGGDKNEEQIASKDMYNRIKSITQSERQREYELFQVNYEDGTYVIKWYEDIQMTDKDKHYETQHQQIRD